MCSVFTSLLSLSVLKNFFYFLSTCQFALVWSIDTLVYLPRMLKWLVSTFYLLLLNFYVYWNYHIVLLILQFPRILRLAKIFNIFHLKFDNCQEKSTTWDITGSLRTPEVLTYAIPVSKFYLTWSGSF